MHLNWSQIAAVAAAFAVQCATATAATDIKIGLSLDHPSTGISFTKDGRLFVLLARPIDGTSGPQIVEWKKDNTTIAYPDQEWNSWAPGKNPANHLIRVNAQRVGPDGSLWLVDTGSPGFGAPVLLPDGAKIVKVNTTTNKVDRVYSLGNVSSGGSFVDDIRFSKDGKRAYLTDAGVPPGLMVLDLETGMAQRMLDDHVSTTAYMPISAEGSLLYGLDGNPSYIHADQLEVSPDGRWLYYSPCSGGMWRIETNLLDKAFYNASLRYELGDYVQPYALTASTGGTAIDADGNMYVSDTDRQSINRIAPNGTMSLLVHDPRLLWVDAMWIDSNGTLWMPAAQLNRGIPFNNGTSKIQKPVYVYKLDIGIKPPSIDHE